MSLLLLFNQGATAAVGTIGGGGIIRHRDSYNRKEVDALYDEWQRAIAKVKNKKAKKAVEEAVEALEAADVRGMLSALAPAIDLQATIEALTSGPSPALINEIREQTELLQRMLDEEDEDDIMLMVWAIH